MTKSYTLTKEAAQQIREMRAEIVQLQEILGIRTGRPGKKTREPFKPYQPFPVRLTQTGGSAGTSSAQCSFTYSVYEWGDVQKSNAIGTAIAAISNSHRTLNATMTAATIGTAFRDYDGTLKLWEAQEKFSQTNCAAGFDSESSTLAAYFSGGTAYSLTNTSAQVVINSADAEIIIPGAGQWLIRGRVNLKYNAATFAANRTVSLILRETNNENANLANSATSVVTRIVTTHTETMGVIEIPEIYYSTENDDDVVSIWASIDTVPSAGSLDITEASLVIEME